MPQQLPAIGAEVPTAAMPTGLVPIGAEVGAPLAQTITEPTDYWSGFLHSLATTGRQTVGGVVSSLNPLPLVNALVHGNPNPSDADTARAAQARMDWLKRIGRGDPEAGGQAIGALGTALVLPRVVSATGTTAKTSAQQLMQGTLKPTLGMLRRNNGSAAPLVKTLLEEGINVTPGGIDRLNRLLDVTNAQISDALSASGGRVQPLRVASRLNQTARTFTNQVNPTADLQAISDTGQQFLDHPALTEPDMSVQQAQEMKIGTYKQIRKSYGQLSNASVEAQKALARGLKEEIANEVPSVAKYNAREANLLQALDAVTRRVAISGNANPMGLTWIAHNPVTFLAAMMDRSSIVKSLIAHGLYKSAGAAAGVPPAFIRSAVISIVAGTPTAGTIAHSDDEPAQALSGSTMNPGRQ